MVLAQLSPSWSQRWFQAPQSSQSSPRWCLVPQWLQPLQPLPWDVVVASVVGSVVTVVTGVSESSNTCAESAIERPGR